MTPTSSIEAPKIAAALRDVTLTYDGYVTRALSRVNLEVRRGEILCVLGVKGSGKSSLLGLLAGQMRPTEGRVEVFGHSTRGRGAKSLVGYVPGIDDGVHSSGFFAKFFAPKIQRSAGRGVARMTQAMLGNRELLVFDDPLVGLAGAEKTECRLLIQDLAAKGKTVVVSSDSLMEVKDWGHRFAVLHEGRIQGVGTLTELLAGHAALRYLPALLPRDMTNRLLQALRHEVQSQRADVPRVTASEDREGPVDSLSSDSLPPTRQKDSIDHEKLEGLTKQKKGD